MPTKNQMQTVVKALFLTLSFGLFIYGQNNGSKQSINVTYIGNEGILIEAGNQQVVIDGIHGKYMMYTALEQLQLDDLLNARKPFERVNLILASHFHLDHFNSKMVGAHLQNNPKAKLICTQQAADDFAKNFAGFEQIKDRVQSPMPNFKERTELTFPNGKVSILRLWHSGPLRTTENLGYLLTVNGKKLLHVGDADMSAENFEPYKLNNEMIDVAFLPFWYLTDPKGAAFVRQYVPAKQVVAIHIPPADAEKVLKQVKENYPEAVCFTTLMEQRIF